MLNLDKVIRIGRLFSFYGPLLTDKQQEFVRLYYHHDLSLGEIAEQKDISRQAVYDNLNRSEDALNEYENKLQLLKHYDSIESELDNLEEIIDNLEFELDNERLSELKNVLFRLQAYQEGELV